MWPLVALAIALLANLIFTPGFFHVEVRDGRLFGSLIDIVNRAVPVLLLAMGMTLVIATGGVDLSVGAVMAITGAVAACLIARPTDSFVGHMHVDSLAVIIVISLVVAAACGLINGVLVGRVGVQPIVATLLLMVAGRGVAQLITNGQIVTFTDKSFSNFGSGAFLGLPIPVWVFVAFALMVSLLARRTTWGGSIEAVGNNASASRLVGINASRIKTSVYVLCALGAGIAGLLTTADIKGADANNAGQYLELDAILAVCVGGTSMAGGRFTLTGTMVGALLMQTVTTTILTRGISAEATFILKALVVIGVCLLQSPTMRGRFARRSLA